MSKLQKSAFRRKRQERVSVSSASPICAAIILDPADIGQQWSERSPSNSHSQVCGVSFPSRDITIAALPVESTVAC